MGADNQNGIVDSFLRISGRSGCMLGARIPRWAGFRTLL
jgi:hypothetical protein